MDYYEGYPKKICCPECREDIYIMPTKRTATGLAAFTCSICDAEWVYKPYLLSLGLAFDKLQADPSHHEIYIVRGEGWAKATGFDEHPNDIGVQVEGQWTDLPHETMVMLVKAVGNE